METRLKGLRQINVYCIIYIIMFIDTTFNTIKWIRAIKTLKVIYRFCKFDCFYGSNPFYNSNILFSAFHVSITLFTEWTISTIHNVTIIIIVVLVTIFIIIIIIILLYLLLLLLYLLLLLLLLFYYVVTEDGTAMEVEADVPQATHVDHKQVLDTLSAVCTHATLVKCVIPELLEHGRNLSVGELWFQVLLLL